MKTLHEIIREEISQFYPAQPRIEGGILRADIGAIQTDIVRRKQEFMARIENDPALVELCFAMVNQIIAIGQVPAMRQQDRQDAYTQALVEAVVIWERSHERFNEQLEPRALRN